MSGSPEATASEGRIRTRAPAWRDRGPGPVLGLGLALACLIGAAACSETTAPVTLPENVPAELEAGERAFNTFCARCHGERALGTDQGPPLIHKIYEPNHHGDAAFYRAAAQGVRAHHWQFGNMPKVEGVTEEEVTEIIGYVRWLQRQAGIY